MVECGANCTIIMSESGKLYSFGDNRYGQLGIPACNEPILGTPTQASTSLKKVKAFSYSEEHAAYLDVSGNVYTWGFGGDGQLGLGDRNSTQTP